MPEPHKLRAEIFLPTPADVPALLPESRPLIIRFKSAIFSPSDKSFYRLKTGPGSSGGPQASFRSRVVTFHYLTPPFSPTLFQGRGFRSFFG